MTNSWWMLSHRNEASEKLDAPTCAKMMKVEKCYEIDSTLTRPCSLFSWMLGVSHNVHFFWQIHLMLCEQTVFEMFMVLKNSKLLSWHHEEIFKSKTIRFLTEIHDVISIVDSNIWTLHSCKQEGGKLWLSFPVFPTKQRLPKNKGRTHSFLTKFDFEERWTTAWTWRVHVLIVHMHPLGLTTSLNLLAS